MKRTHFQFHELEWIVINLPHREDRLRETSAQLQQIGVEDFFHFPAVTATKCPETFPVGCENIGHAGCLESHIAVLDLIASEGDEDLMYVVCEDDVEFPKNFRRELLPLLHYVDFGAGLLHYIGANNLEGRRLMPINDRLWKAQGLFATHCYAVHKTTAGRVANWLKRRTHFVDVMLVELQQRETLTCFDAPLAFQRASFSDILRSDVHHEIRAW
jgi:GR25 family glycosyltransferase involved in LPS biosynthesis